MDDVKDLYKANEPTSSSGLFLKLKDGDNFRIRILGIPAVFDSTFTDQETKEKSVRTQYAWPIYNHDLKKVQVFQNGATIYNGLNSLIQDVDWGDPADYDIKVSRVGSVFSDTKYNVAPSPKNLELPEDLEIPDVLEISKKSEFNSNVHMLGALFTPVEEDVVLEDIEDSPADLSEIPF